MWGLGQIWDSVPIFFGQKECIEDKVMLSKINFELGGWLSQGKFWDTVSQTCFCLKAARKGKSTSFERSYLVCAAWGQFGTVSQFFSMRKSALEPCALLLCVLCCCRVVDICSKPTLHWLIH